MKQGDTNAHWKKVVLAWKELTLNIFSIKIGITDEQRRKERRKEGKKLVNTLLVCPVVVFRDL